MVLLQNGEVYVFGNNNYGQLGQGDTTIRYSILSHQGLVLLKVKLITITLTPGHILKKIPNDDIEAANEGSLHHHSQSRSLVDKKRNYYM